MNSTTTLFGHLPQMNSTFLLYVLKLQNCYLTKAEKKNKKKKKKMLYASALSQKGALKRISTIQGYIQGPLRKKQLIALYRK